MAEAFVRLPRDSRSRYTFHLKLSCLDGGGTPAWSSIHLNTSPFSQLKTASPEVDEDGDNGTLELPPTRTGKREALRDLASNINFDDSRNISPEEKQRRSTIRKVVQVAVDHQLGWEGTSVSLPKKDMTVKGNLEGLCTRGTFFKYKSDAVANGNSAADLNFSRGRRCGFSEDALRNTAITSVAASVLDAAADGVDETKVLNEAYMKSIQNNKNPTKGNAGRGWGAICGESGVGCVWGGGGSAMTRTTKQTALSNHKSTTVTHINRGGTKVHLPV